MYTNVYDRFNTLPLRLDNHSLTRQAIGRQRQYLCSVIRHSIFRNMAYMRLLNLFYYIDNVIVNTQFMHSLVSEHLKCTFIT